MSSNGSAPTPGYAPIRDVGEWLGKQGSLRREFLNTLGGLLLGVTAVADDAESAERFTRRHLGDPARLAVEDDDLSPARAVATALAVAELLEAHQPELGPALHSDPPSWTATEIGADRLRHPRAMRAYFPAGSLSECDCILVINTRPNHGRPTVAVLVRPECQDEARRILDRIAARASERNPFRGRILRASAAAGLRLDPIDLPATLTRSTVVVPQRVWEEIDLGIRAVRDQHELLNSHGLGVRRGVLLVGPPGTGKSAVSAVVAQEMHASGATVVYVEARAGASLLTDLVEEVESWKGPVLLVLEDVDLWVRDRARGGSGLSELLQAMDIDPAARILTLASTNDAEVLDRASIRTGRFDSIVEVPYPDRAAAAQILAALLDGLPGGDVVDTAAVAAALPDGASGSDIREIVRRVVLSGQVTTAGLVGEIGAGRYRPTVPGSGAYL